MSVRLAAALVALGSCTTSSSDSLVPPPGREDVPRSSPPPRRMPTSLPPTHTAAGRRLSLWYGFALLGCADRGRPFQLDQLEVLEAIDRFGGFAAAARHLHRATSAVSYAVKALESALGVELFERTGGARS